MVSSGKVMVIMAHPDDPEFICGGTVARWAESGKDITYVLATRGESGSSNPMMTPERLASIREDEQRSAARILGVKEVIFLDYSDGQLIFTAQLRRELTRIIRLYRPDSVITFDPSNRYVGAGGYFNHLNHPDHRAVGEAALDAVFPYARDRLAYYELWEKEGLDPHEVKEIYLGGTTTPDTWVDITEYIDKKIAAIREHRSQITEFEDLIQRIRKRDGRDINDSEANYEEGFKHIVLE